MKQKLIFSSLFAFVLGAAFLIVWSERVNSLFNLPSLAVVFGGTIIMTMVSQSIESVLKLFSRLIGNLKNPLAGMGQEESIILRLAANYRAGRMRATEEEMELLPEGVFKYGVQLILNLTSRDNLPRLLKWRIGALEEKDREGVQILRTMAAYAPAFGMLGTLLGLVKMLHGLGDSGLGQLGNTMGFAMMTTVYGLVAANLIFKPLAINLERRARQNQAWRHTQAELVQMLFVRSQPKLFQDYIRAVSDNAESESAEAPLLRLVRA